MKFMVASVLAYTANEDKRDVELLPTLESNRYRSVWLDPHPSQPQYCLARGGGGAGGGMPQAATGRKG